MKNVKLYYNDNNYNKTVSRRRTGGKSFCLTFRPSVRSGRPANLPVELIADIGIISKLKEVQSELKREIKLRKQFNLFYIISLIIFFIISCIPDTSFYTPDIQLAWSWAGLLLLLPPAIFLAKKNCMSRIDLGITIFNLKKNIIEGLLFSFCLCVIMLVIRYLTIPHGESFINWKSFSSFSGFLFLMYMGTYWIHCYLQEFITRGVLQGLTQRFFKDSHFMFPVFLVSLLFCAAHIRISLFFGVMTFVISIIFGYIYYRHKNLLGVSIVHYITGMLAMALGYC